jgi:hypothetical protein
VADGLELQEPKLRQQFFHRDRVEYWAFASQIISALAVVISLVFVGIQLRESNIVALRAESNSAQSHWSAFRGSIYANRDTAVLFIAGMEGKQLDAADEMRFLYLIREHGWATFQIWDRKNKGLVPRWHFSVGAAGDYLRVICTPGGAKAWATIRREFPPLYVSDLDRLAVPYAKANQVRCTP